MGGLRKALGRIWPRSLKGQVLLAIALALLFGLLHWLPLKQRAANDDRV